MTLETNIQRQDVPINPLRVSYDVRPEYYEINGQTYVTYYWEGAEVACVSEHPDVYPRK